MQTNSGLESYRVTNYLTEDHANHDDCEDGGGSLVLMSALVAGNCEPGNQEWRGYKGGLHAFIYGQQCEVGSFSVV